MNKRRILAAIQLVVFLTPLLAPAYGFELPALTVDPRLAGSQVLDATGNVTRSVVRTTGNLTAGARKEVGGALTQIYEDATGGKFLFVAGPTRSAVMVAPQVHTAARNSVAALRAAKQERAAQAAPKGFRRHLPTLGRPDWKPAPPVTKQVVGKQFATPFSPANMLATVGFTAAGGLLQAALDEDVRWQDSLDFLGDKTFWGGVAGSGVGYAIASLMALAIFPVGGTLLPTLAPMIVGSVGSILGWMIGASLADGKSFSESIGQLSLGSIAGKTLGSTAGVLMGVSLGSALGGTAGAIAGPLGAVAGALLFSRIGASWGEEAGNGVQSILRTEDGGVVVPLKGRYAATYNLLVDALGRNDKEEAQIQLEALRELAAKDNQTVRIPDVTSLSN